MLVPLHPAAAQGAWKPDRPGAIVNTTMGRGLGHRNVPTWREQGIDAAVSVWRMNTDAAAAAAREAG